MQLTQQQMITLMEISHFQWHLLFMNMVSLRVQASSNSKWNTSWGRNRSKWLKNVFKIENSGPNIRNPRHEIYIHAGQTSSRCVFSIGSRILECLLVGNWSVQTVDIIARRMDREVVRDLSTVHVLSKITYWTHRSGTFVRHAKLLIKKKMKEAFLKMSVHSTIFWPQIQKFLSR